MDRFATGMAAALLLATVPLLQGCPRSTVSVLSTAVSNIETIGINTLLLEADVWGKYSIPTKNLYGACGIAHLDQIDLASSLAAGRQIIPATATTPTFSVPFSVDTIETCAASVNRIEYGTADLQVITYDPNGAVASRTRPVGVGNVRFNGSGYVFVSAHGLLVTGAVASRQRVPGPLDSPIFELKGAAINRVDSGIYNSQVSHPFAAGEVTNVEDNPERIGITFRFIAKHADEETKLLLVWGSLLMRTDL